MQNNRWTIKQLEAMTTHEVAELLANVVLLLRRLPNVPMSGLSTQAEPAKQEKPAEAEPSSNA